MMGDVYNDSAFYIHALDSYALAICHHPNELDVALKLGKMLITCQRFRKGCNLYEQILDKCMDSVVLLQLINVYVCTGQLSKAEAKMRILANKKCLDAMHEAEKIHVMLLVDATKAVNKEEVTKSGLHNLIKEIRTRIVDLKPSGSSKLCEKARKILSKLFIQSVQVLNHGDTKDFKVFGQILEKSGLHLELVLEVMDIMLHQGQYETNQELVNKIHGLCPWHPGSVVVEGRLLMNSFKIDEVLSLYDNFLRLHPCSYIVTIEYLYLLERRGQLAKVEDIGNALMHKHLRKASADSDDLYMSVVSKIVVIFVGE